MKTAEEHRWALDFTGNPTAGWRVVCLDPCPTGEERDGDRFCFCAVGVEEPSLELVGKIEVGLSFRHECWGHYEGGPCDCDFYFDITSAALMSEDGRLASDE